MGLETNKNNFKILFISLLVIFCSGVIYLGYLSRPDNFTSREVRTVICAREMIASGNYLIPTLSGEPRFRKPPLPYWLISLTTQLNNGRITNTSSRIPSVISGMFVLLLTWWWALQLKADGNPKPALLSPLILGMIPLFFLDVRSSEAEILLCFFILSASYFFWKASTTSEISGKYLLLAYLFIAGGVLTKGPLALIMPLLPYIMIRKKSFFKEWKWHAIGLMLAAIPVGVWVLAVYAYYPESIRIFIKELFVKRFGGDAKHAEPFYYYLILLLAQFIVFIPILFSAVQKTFKNKPEYRFNLYFILLNLFWLSVMSSKQRHYVIPVLPHLSIVLGSWLSEQAEKDWAYKYFSVISYILAAGVLLFGLVLLPKSILIIVIVLISTLLVMFLPRHFTMPGLWKSAIFFIAMMHLGDHFVTHTGNRLLYEQLMAKWIHNQPIGKTKPVFVEKPTELMAFYFFDIKDYVSPDDKEFITKSDYFIVEGEERITSFLTDDRFYLVKGIDKIRKGRKKHQIAVFGKMNTEKDNLFHYRLLFLCDKGNRNYISKNVASNLDLRTFYAIIPEINPLASLSLFSKGKQMKWDQTYLPVLNNGVELICKFDPLSSLYSRSWFNDAAYWGVTPDLLQRRTFFNDRYFLWTIDQADVSSEIHHLEKELGASSSLFKLVFFQQSLSNTNDIPVEYIRRLKEKGAVIINELTTDNVGAIDMQMEYNQVICRTRDASGNIIHTYFYPTGTGVLNIQNQMDR